MSALESRDRSAIVQAALEYVDLGFKVLPLHVLKDGRCTCKLGSECPMRSRGKHPVPSRGCKDATDQAALIEHWWNVSPWANIAIAMPDDVFAVDIDGQKGENEWLELTTRNPELPLTVEQKSGSGGRHILFRIDPQKWRVTNRKLGGRGSKVDIIGQGKYIVAEPSIHACGGSYEWISDPRMGEDIAQCPAWLLPHVAYERGRESSEPEIFDGELHDTTVDRIASMFGFLDADDYHTWIQVGMALRIEFGDAAFDLWDRWSQMSAKYDAKAQAKKWKSFSDSSHNSPVTMASIYRLAYQSGWADPVGIEISQEVAEWLRPDDDEPEAEEPEEGELEQPADLRQSQVITAIQDFASDEEMEWALDELLPKGGFGVFYGPPASGKSWAAMDLALHMATGHEEWAGIGIESGPIGYIVNEGVHGFRRRTFTWMQDRPRPDAWVMPSPFQLDGQAAHDIIKAFKARPVSLIVLDTIANAFQGDENSQEDMGRFIAFVAAIRDKCDCALIAVHHSNKQGGVERGSSVLRGAADLMMKFKPLAKGRFHASDDKVKDGEGNVELMGQLVDVELRSGRTHVRPEWIVHKDVLGGQDSDDIAVRRSILSYLINTGATFGLSTTDISRAVQQTTGTDASIVKAKIPALERQGLLCRCEVGGWKITKAGLEMIGGHSN